MTALSVNPPFPIFTDSDGQPLEDGYIWIGKANLDPQSNPIFTYWDSGLTQLAGQPVRTLNGYPSNNGTPARIFVDSDYSIRVLNKKGSLVYSSPTANDRLSSELVTFIQSGTGAVTRTSQNKMRETVSVLDFGAIGDGVADDTVALASAISTQKPLDFGGLTYRITSPISKAFTSNVYWNGRNAKIIYDGPHVEYALLLDSAGAVFSINDITIDGGKLCNRCLVLNNNTDSYSTISLNNVFVKRAKRISSFSGGEGLFVRGSFTTFNMNGGGASDCELPAGQGTFGVIGIRGITILYYSSTRYVKEVNISGVHVEKIYSSDLSYQYDQDGIGYFTDTVGSTKVVGTFSCNSSTFVNCYGRSIKTQCRDTNVSSCTFVRTEGLSSGVGNGEIDSQTGNANFSFLEFSYSNGNDPGTCVNVSGGFGTPGMNVIGCNAILDASTTLSRFASCFPSTGSLSRINISSNKVYGKVVKFFEYLCNGDKNYAEVSNNYVNGIQDGPTSQKALVYVQASGATSPKYAYVTAIGNVNGDDASFPSLVRDSVSGTSMPSNLSAWQNYGFYTEDIATSADVNGLKTFAPTRIPFIAPAEGSGYFNLQNYTITSGATQAIAIKNLSTVAIVFVVCQFSSTSYAVFVNNDTTNTVISKGAAFEIGNAADPGVGTFRIWTSGINAITIKNTNAFTRKFTLFVMAT